MEIRENKKTPLPMTGLAMAVCGISAAEATNWIIPGRDANKQTRR
jgi:uncharacterized membrane protein YadS